MNAKNQILELQIGQIEHDNQYHKDIVRLSTPRRVTHLVLHLAKYAGKFVSSKKNNDYDFLESTLVDSLIVSLGIANALDIELIKQINDDLSVHSNLDSYGNTLAKSAELDKDRSFEFICDNFPIYVGHMAKACESLDHLEPFNAREVLNKSILQIIILLLTSAAILKSNVFNLIQKRWDEVEKGYPLRAKLEEHTLISKNANSQ